MLFKFQKYINPINYFNLLRVNDKTIFPEYDSLPPKIKKKIEYDKFYLSKKSSNLDAAWQAIQKGYIGDAKTITFEKTIPLEDEYRFIKKYYNKFWIYYIIILRILSFNNPVKEIKAFLNVKKINRKNVYNNPIIYEKWQNFKSPLLMKKPKISVIIPTLNRYKYLKDVLNDLEKQDYQNFNVIIVDQSEPFQRNFYNQFNLDMDIIYQEEKALWLARNKAIKKSDAEYILLFDDDSRVDKDWISNHLKCIDFFNAPISSGVSLSVIGAKIPETYSYFKLSDQIDTGNVMIHKESVFKKIGLFDRQFEKQRMGDGEFGLRVYKAGFLNISNPYAKRIHLKVGKGGLRQMGSWDAIRPTSWFAPKPIPSVLYYMRKYYGNKLTFFYLLKTIPPSLLPYKYKANTKLIILSYILSILLFPLVFFQVRKSWNLSSEKLKEGDKIEYL